VKNSNEVEDPMEKDPKFRSIKHIRGTDAQLILTQYWPGDSTNT
jgi:hypothetical protein